MSMQNLEGSPNGLTLDGCSDATNSTSSTLIPLGIIPEKASFAHQIRRTVPAQYWGISQASASVPDGALGLSVSDPAPLPLLAGSGLSRPQLVLATQAVKLPGRPSLPGLPSVCHDQGGLVLDRILAHGSGDSWWAAVSGRARLGRLVAQRADLVTAVADPASYSLSATSRVQLSRSTVLRSRLDWSPPNSTASTSIAASTSRTALATDASATIAAQQQQQPTAAGWATAVPLSLSSQLQSRVGRWAEVRADLAVFQRTAGGRAVGNGASSGSAGPNVELGQSHRPAAAGAVTPLLLGLQAGSVPTSGGPLVWRCGVLQVTAPPTMPLAGGLDGPTDMAGLALKSAVYVQGSVALQGERVLWQGSKRPPRRRSHMEAIQSGGATVQQTATNADGPWYATTTTTTTAAALVGASGDGGPSGLHQAGAATAPQSAGPYTPSTRRATPSIYPLSSNGGGEDGEDDEDEDDGVVASPTIGAAGVSGGRALRPPSRVPGAVAAGGGAATVGSGGGSGGSGGSATAAVAAPPFGIELPSAGALQEALVDVTHSFSRLRDDVTAATKWIGSGGLLEQLKAASAPGAAPKQRHGAGTWADDVLVAPVPWSSFVGKPHVKVAGVAGITARAPAIVLAHGSVAPGGSGSGAAAAALRPTRLAWLQDLGLSRLLRRRGRGEGSGMDGDGAATHAARSALHPFASAAASVQAGRFSGWLLDFTRVSAQLDCGLWGPGDKSPAGDGKAPAWSKLRHPAFALGDTGAWHALSLSLSQQLLGPLRLAADWRYQLASSRPLTLPPPPPTPVAALAPIHTTVTGAAAAARSWLGDAAGAVAAHTVGMRPQLLEAVYALDLSVPGTRGAARVVAWYSPQRREGMIELRMF